MQSFFYEVFEINFFCLATSYNYWIDLKGNLSCIGYISKIIYKYNLWYEIVRYYFLMIILFSNILYLTFSVDYIT